MVVTNFKIYVKLSLATITHLDENEDEKWVHVIHLHY
jgi:hypothetical protein